LFKWGDCGTNESEGAIVISRVAAAAAAAPESASLGDVYDADGEKTVTQSQPRVLRRKKLLLPSSTANQLSRKMGAQIEMRILRS